MIRSFIKRGLYRNVRKCLTRCLYDSLFAEHSLLPLLSQKTSGAELKLQQVWLSTAGARKADKSEAYPDISTYMELESDVLDW